MEKRLLILIGSLILGILLGYTIFNINGNKSKSINTQEITQIKELFNDINSINGNMKEENLNENTTYYNELNYMCQKYKKEDSVEIIQKIRDLFELAFTSQDYFELAYDENNNESLYVCIPKDCVVSQIDVNNIKIKNTNKNKKRVYLDSKMSVIVKYSNDKWMVEKALIYCK